METRPLFVLTPHCTSRKHCATCRDKEGGRSWRQSLGSAFDLPEGAPDFACPVGLEWGSTPLPPPAPETQPPPKKSSSPFSLRGTRKGCGGCSGKKKR